MLNLGFLISANHPWLLEVLAAKRDLFYQDDSNQDAGNPSPNVIGISAGHQDAILLEMGLDMRATSNWGFRATGGVIYMIAHGKYVLFFLLNMC